MNLMANAEKFTENGYIKIEAQIIGREKLQVSVIDTGIGVKTEDLGMLFLPFQQVDMSSTKEYGGTGLGLHLCKKIVGLLNGDISVESEYGKGSQFTFTVPLLFEAQNEKDISD